MENKKKIVKFGGLFKNFVIDYDELEQDLKELNRNSSAHILDKFEGIKNANRYHAPHTQTAGFLFNSETL